MLVLCFAMNAKHLPKRLYSDFIASEILGRVAAGEALTRVCDDPMLPGRDVVWGWIRDDLNGFGDGYARAKQQAMERMAEEILEISDDESGDSYLNSDGQWVANHASVQRAKLKVDTRKWLMAKLAPNKYGDRVALDHGVQKGAADQLRDAEARREKIINGEDDATTLRIIEGGQR